MIICEKQIMQLITIAHAHAANCMRFGEYKAQAEVQYLLVSIDDQQSEELKVIE